MSAPVILITGASRGLGEAIARQAARMGARLVLAARSAEALQSLANEIQYGGGEALAVQADVRQERDCAALVQAATGQFGQLDALVNNAGIIEPIGPIAEADPSAWELNWVVNVLGPVLLIRQALPFLRQTHGRVVNISSGAAVNVVGGWGAYSAAKAALNHLTRLLAAEEHQVTAVAVRPGLVDTAMQAAIRQLGAGRMASQNYHWLSGLHTRGELLPPDLPGRAAAVLALRAPHEWSGEVLSWDEERVQALVEAG